MRTHPDYKNAVFWIGGEFNLPDINWSNQEIVSTIWTQIRVHVLLLFSIQSASLYSAYLGLYSYKFLAFCCQEDVYLI